MVRAMLLCNRHLLYRLWLFNFNEEEVISTSLLFLIIDDLLRDGLLLYFKIAAVVAESIKILNLRKRSLLENISHPLPFSDSLFTLFWIDFFNRRFTRLFTYTAGRFTCSFLI